VPFLLAVGRPTALIIALISAIAVAVACGIEAVLFLVAGVVAICTKDDKRRAACLEIVQIACPGWPRRSRSHGRMS
jgi:hypothetical protein